MPARKRKKKTRQMRSHGWGSRKKHRGKGHKGGAGHSGYGKRTNPKEPSIWKDRKYFGKYGFIKKGIKPRMVPLNIKYLDENIDKIIEKKLAKKEKEIYVINLEDLGFNKLLGSGKINKRMKITTEHASKRAVQSVKKAGGEVILPEKKKEKKETKKEIKEEEVKKETKKEIKEEEVKKEIKKEKKETKKEIKEEEVKKESIKEKETEKEKHKNKVVEETE